MVKKTNVKMSDDIALLFSKTNVTKKFGGKEFSLDAVTASERSANFSAGLHREKGYFVRITKITSRRWGVWIRKKDKGDK